MSGSPDSPGFRVPDGSTSAPGGSTSAPDGSTSASDGSASGPVFPRQFWLLALGFIVLITGVDMSFPFESTYLHERMGVSMTAIGLLIGLPVFVALPLYALGGALTDRYGRKPAMVTGILVVAALYWTFALAGSLWAIGGAIALEAAFGWALFLTGSNAMVADLVPFSRRAEAYSITRVTLHIGMVIGPLLAGVLLAGDPTFRTLFLTGGAICGAYVLIVIVAFRETRPEAAAVEQRLLETLRGYVTVFGDRRYLVFCAMALLPLYGFGQIWSVFPMVLRAEHGVAPATWGLVLTFYAVTVALTQFPVIRLSRRGNKLLLMAAASAFTGIGLGGAGLVPWRLPTLAFVFVLGQGIVLLVPISSAVAADLSPVPLRGRYMGTWTLVQTGGFALGPTFGGMAMDVLGARGASWVNIGVGLAGAVLFALTAKRLGVGLGTPASALHGQSPSRAA